MEYLAFKPTPSQRAPEGCIVDEHRSTQHYLCRPRHGSMYATPKMIRTALSYLWKSLVSESRTRLKVGVVSMTEGGVVQKNGVLDDADLWQVEVGRSCVGVDEHQNWIQGTLDSPCYSMVIWRRRL